MTKEESFDKKSDSCEELSYSPKCSTINSVLLKEEGEEEEEGGGEKKRGLRALIGALSVLLAVQFLLTVNTHCLNARLIMSHTLILLLLLIGMHTSKEARRTSVWLMISLVAAYGLLFVCVIHSLKDIFELHHSHFHYAEWLIACSLLDVLLKIWALLAGSGKYLGLHFNASLIFHFCPAVTAAIFLLIKFFIDKQEHHDHSLVQLDPVLTIICSILLALMLIPPVRKNIPILLLAVPKGFDIIEFKKDFQKKYPNANCHDLHVYQESDGSFDVSLHITIREPIDPSDTSAMQQGSREIQRIAQEVRSVFARAGGRRVTVQTELALSSTDHTESRKVSCAANCLGGDCSKLRCCDDHSALRSLRHIHN